MLTIKYFQSTVKLKAKNCKMVYAIKAGKKKKKISHSRLLLPLALTIALSLLSLSLGTHPLSCHQEYPPGVPPFIATTHHRLHRRLCCPLVLRFVTQTQLAPTFFTLSRRLGSHFLIWASGFVGFSFLAF